MVGAENRAEIAEEKVCLLFRVLSVYYRPPVRNGVRTAYPSGFDSFPASSPCAFHIMEY